MKFIPHSRPTLGDKEISAAADVIASRHIAQGKVAEKFESAFARQMGLDHAAATSSGTAALHLTLLALGVGPGHEVIIPSYVCTALLNAVNYTGARPVIADIDQQTFNMDPDDVEKRLTTRTRAVILPHLFGMPADIEAFTRMNIAVIEDCAQSIGSIYKGKPVGSFGDAAIFSFYATKVITCGEGGMVASRSSALIERIRDLRQYDNRNHYRLRFNYKMTDMAAAIGLVQLSRLQGFVERRRTLARKYRQAFHSLGFKSPGEHPGHIYYRYVIDLGTDADIWIKKLSRKGIDCARPVFRPLHRYLGLEGYPRTGIAWSNAISLPIYPSLSDHDQSRVIRAVLETYRELS